MVWRSSDPLAAIANRKYQLNTFLATTEVTPLKSCRTEGYTKCRRRLIEWFWWFDLQVAQGERLEFGSDKFVECEEVGVRESCRAAFVLVAGGFAERLRLNGGIKVEYLTLVKSNSFESQFFQKTHDNRRIACRVRNLVAASISLASYYPVIIILHHAHKRILLMDSSRCPWSPPQGLVSWSSTSRIFWLSRKPQLVSPSLTSLQYWF